jgi:integrase
VFQRKDGRWVARLRADGEERSWASPDRAVVVAKMLAARRKSRRPTSSRSGLVADALRRWLEQETRVRPSTMRSYRMIVETYLVPALGARPLEKLSTVDVAGYLRTVRGDRREQLAPRTLQLHHAVLRRAISMAERDGLVDRNVVRLVPAPRVSRPAVRPLTAGQARAFLEATAGDRLGPLYAVAVGTGMRQGELLGLRWTDVDLVAERIAVAGALTRIGKAYAIAQPKTPKSRRTVAIAGFVVRALELQRRRQAEERLAVGPAWGAKYGALGLVFTTPTGEPLHGSVVTTAFQAAIAAAGLPAQRFHDLRHAAASTMLAAGVPLHSVMETLGHSSITTTANIYGHLDTEGRADVARRMEEALGS